LWKKGVAVVGWEKEVVKGVEVAVAVAVAVALELGTKAVEQC
jgi:hypothetical protein